MNITLHFVIPDPVQLAIYLAIGILVALLAGALAGMRSGLSYIGTVLLATIGAWLFASFLHIQVANDISLYTVPLIQAFLGAIIFGLLGVVLFARRDVVVHE